MTNHTYSNDSKKWKHRISQISRFLTLREDCARLEGHRTFKICWNKKLYKILWPRSLARSALNVENREIHEIHGTVFLNSESTCDLTNFQPQFMIIKLRPDLLPLFTIFYDLTVLRNLSSKAKMRQLGASGNKRIWLSGNDGLSFLFIKSSIQEWNRTSATNARKASPSGVVSSRTWIKSTAKNTILATNRGEKKSTSAKTAAFLLRMSGKSEIEGKLLSKIHKLRTTYEIIYLVAQK